MAGAVEELVRVVGTRPSVFPHVPGIGGLAFQVQEASEWKDSRISQRAHETILQVEELLRPMTILRSRI